MKLDKQQNYWIQRNQSMIQGILEKRIDDLKEQLLEAPEDKRNLAIAVIKEYKIGLGLLREITQDKKPEDLTGV